MIRFDQSSDGEQTAVLQGEWQLGDAKTLRDAGVTSLVLNSTRGFRGADLEFLREAPLLRRLHVVDMSLGDVRGVEHLPDLEYLNLSCYADQGPDLSKLRKLRKCFLEWYPGAETVFDAPSMEDLYVNSYPYEDLAPITRLRGLHRLIVANGPVRTLKGIELLSKLRELGLYRLRKLTSLSGIEPLAKLERLDIKSCRNFDDIEPLRSLLNLRWLAVIDCRRIESLKPLAPLAKLEELYFYGETIVRDGDLLVLTQLPGLRTVAFGNRRHYSHSSDEIESLLQAHAS